MSKDLYMYAEKRVAAMWQFAEEPRLIVETVFGIETGEQWYEPKTLYFDGGRSLLFQVLADPEWCPAQMTSFGAPRGLPPDLSPILKAHAARRMDGAFDHSWLSLTELMNFDWYNRNVPVYGYVRPEHAAHFDNKKGFPVGVPSNACRWESIGEPLDEKQIPADPGWVTVSWVRSHAELVGMDFPDTILPALQTFAAPEDVRVVFWFS
jgi:hypothetical protein